ncbi:MAG: response regulator [Rhodoferax sp.]
MIDVVLCDDHAMIRRGLRETLCEATDIRVRAEAENYAGLRSVLRETACDVLVLDLNLPDRNGLEVLVALKDSDPHIRTLVVSMYEADQFAMRCLKAGAYGYLNKTAHPQDIVSAVRTLGQNRKYLTPEVSEMLVANLQAPPTQALHDLLSERELQTLLKIAAGKKLSDIAEELMLSPKTVSVYRARLMEKLHLSSNADIAVYALRNGLI